MKRLARAVDQGRVAGVDVSTEMVRQASARNREGVRSGRVELRIGSIESLPFESETFDAVYATNSAQFWPDLEGGMREVRRVLRSGGRAVVVVQPMSRTATERDAFRWRDRLSAAMHRASFARVATAETVLEPATAVAAIGTK